MKSELTEILSLPSSGIISVKIVGVRPFSRRGSRQESAQYSVSYSTSVQRQGNMNRTGSRFGCYTASSAQEISAIIETVEMPTTRTREVGIVTRQEVLMLTVANKQDRVRKVVVQTHGFTIQQGT